MAFKMSYDLNLPANEKKAAKPVVAAKPAKTGRAARPNSPAAQAEALFEPRPAGAPTPATETVTDGKPDPE